MTMEAGTRLGHYRIVSLLGRGGMADVYRAEDERLGREVALKAVPPEFARDPERVERFEHEVRAAARLTHPNIVTVYEFGQGAGQHFYTMALMPGGDLKARVRAHPDGMPPEEARAVAAAMARALDYAHKRGLVHRDVKPENILFGEDGAPQLTDFGIARAMSSGTRMTAAGMSIGSPHYMSPEQARGQAVDGRSDLYSLGVVLYEMLTGRVPFDVGDTLAVAYAHVNDPVPELPPAQRDWQPVVDRLLAKSPDDRFGSAGELAEVLASDALPQPSATRVTPGRRVAGLAARSKQMATQLMSAPRDGGQAGRLKELTVWLTAAVRSPRGTPLAVAGGALLALVVVGVGYVAMQNAAGPGRQSRAGGGGSAAVQPAPVQPAPIPTRRSDPQNPFDVDRLELAVPDTAPAMVSESGAEEYVDHEEVAAARLEDALGLGRAARRVIQEGLLTAGFDTGEADGLFGARTRAALRAWQATAGAATTGYLDESTAATLLAAGAEALRLAAQRQAELEAEVQREAEARRQAELEAEAQREAEARRQAELEAERRRRAARRLLVPGRPSRGTIDADNSRTGVWAFEGVARQGVVVEASSRDFDTIVRLVSPTGDQVGYDDDGGEGQNSRLRVTLPRSGRYQVTVAPYSDGDGGAYEVVVRFATPTDSQRKPRVYVDERFPYDDAADDFTRRCSRVTVVVRDRESADYVVGFRGYWGPSDDRNIGAEVLTPGGARLRTFPITFLKRNLFDDVCESIGRLGVARTPE